MYAMAITLLLDLKTRQRNTKSKPEFLLLDFELLDLNMIKTMQA